MFLSFFFCKLILPFSTFFLHVLEEYQVHLVHLTPNAVLTPSIFAHMYEMFVGVWSSVEVFRHFFYLQCHSPAGSLHVMGACFFKLRPAREGEYIAMILHDKWEDWRRRWLHMSIITPYQHLCLPASPPTAIC